jgi:hypothetical protein
MRAEIRNGTVRDVIDFVDYDVDPNIWIKRLLEQISSGRYEPATPFRFTIGKSNGFSRTMTQPVIPDLVLYRTIVDGLYRKALRREQEHVYFKRERLQQAQNAAQQQAIQQVQWTGQYRMTSQRSFYNWLRFAQYRKHLLLQAVHPYLVVTDVTNFFDSLLHSHVEEGLRGLRVAPRMLGLLFFLLERLSIRQDYASSHAISLPVDEFDCSRTLAHMTLFKQRDYGASSSELGRESSVGQYISNLVGVFKAIPLAAWASVWVNIGDKRGKHGELLNIPARFCIAMSDAGFHLIDHVVWAKESVRLDGTSVGQAMIEPAPRRLNGNGHEPLFRFVLDPKQAWSDTCAVHIPRKNVSDVRYLPETLMECNTSVEGRNLTNVWNISSDQSRASHYAVFPAALIERPVAMTCPLEITEEGPKRRKVLMVPYEEASPVRRGIGKYSKPVEETSIRSGRQDTGRQYIPRKPVTVGWEPDLPAIRRGIVLDPFCGSGSTG